MKAISGISGTGSGATVIIVLLLVVVCALAVKSYLKKLSSGCCGAGRDTVKKVPVKDKNKEHYPHSAKMEIYGMTCANCARRVENGLNQIQGVWAKVNLDQKEALVRMKNPVEEKILRQAVKDAGYTVLSVKIVE